MSSLTRRRWFPLVFAAVAAVGCSSTKPRARTAVELYDQARLSYQISADKLQMSDKVARGESNWRLWNTGDEDGKPRICRLEIVYPHPSRGAGYAQATLITQPAPPSPGAVNLASHQPAAGETVAWTRDVRKRDLDRALGKLRDEGFYRMRQRTKSDITVATFIDGQHSARNWLQLESLDELIWHVRGTGKKVDVASLPVWLAAPTAPGAQAYQNLVARQQAPGVAPPPFPGAAPGGALPLRQVQRLPPLPQNVQLR